MGSEIFLVTIVQVGLFFYSVVTRIIRFALIKFGIIESSMGITYKVHFFIVLTVAIYLPISWFVALRTSANDYAVEFSMKYFAAIHLPIILATLFVLAGPKPWSNLTNASSRRRDMSPRSDAL